MAQYDMTSALRNAYEILTPSDLGELGTLGNRVSVVNGKLEVAAYPAIFGAGSQEYVSARCVIERAIVRHTLQTLEAAGFKLRRESWYDDPTPGQADVDNAVSNLVSSDEVRMTCIKSPGASVTVYFVFGNDGYDCISDWGHKGAEADEIMEKLTAWAEEKFDYMAAFWQAKMSKVAR